MWGVPIIVFYCEPCEKPLTDRKILDRVVALFAEHTADVWYERTAAELLPPGCECPKCGGDASSRKETDILDVWFDSGSSHLAVLTAKNGLPWPSDLYLEGGDQYRGWFHSSLLVGVALRGGRPTGIAPATAGRSMAKAARCPSRSATYIEPDKIIKKYGADVLRLWAASVEFNEDVRISDDDSHAAHRGLSQAAQHVPVRARQSDRFRSGDATRCRRPRCWRSTSGF